MRLIIDTLVALMLAAVLAGVVTHWNRSRDDDRQVELARGELERLSRQVMLEAALERGPLDQSGYPSTIDPAWFNGDVPFNPLLDDGRPWLEVASAGQRRLHHPVQRTAVDMTAASFWYNPASGIVRARVPAGISDAEALALYNQVNGCSLESLFAAEEAGASSSLGVMIGAAVR